MSDRRDGAGDDPAQRAAADLKGVIRDFRRDQVIDVARRLFGARGSLDVSMEDIASEAGIARSTIYVYFANRDELLRACLTRMYVQLIGQLSPLWETEARPDEQLFMLVNGVFELLDENPAFFRLALATFDMVGSTSAAISAGTSMGVEIEEIGLNVSRLLESIYVEGRDAGQFVDMDPGHATQLVGQMLYGAMLVRAGELDPDPREESARRTAEFMVRGLGSVLVGTV